MNLTIGLLIPFLGTTLGAATVFLMRNKMNPKVEKLLLGFASGVMIAASVWSLLIPSINMATEQNKLAWMPAAIGFIFGIVFLLILDSLIPHLHLNNNKPEGIKAKLKKTTMMVFAVTLHNIPEGMATFMASNKDKSLGIALTIAIALHNIPEGMAIGVAFGSIAYNLNGATLTSAVMLAIGIGIQNFPEGSAVSLPLRREGMSRTKSFFFGALSGIVEPISAVIGAILVLKVQILLPILLSFAGGAMIYVVVQELIPESQTNKKKDLMALFTILGFLIMMKMTGKDMVESMEQYQNALSDMSNEAVEYVRGVPVVKTFGQTIFSFKRFKGTIDNYEKWVIAYTKRLRLPMMFYTTAINGVFAFLIAGGILFTRNGVTNELLLNLIFYIVITPVIGTTLTKIMFMSEDAMIVRDALNRIDEVMNEKPLSESPMKHVPNDNGVTLEHVSYSYDGKKNALNDVSLRIEPGQTIALVGASGGGKTTLANIVTRFFDPQEGRIRIGNIDIRDIPKETLMNTVSFVFQNSRLIKASILENVRMAKPNATREEIAHALEAAQCLDIIEKLPNGIDTVVGTNGVYLSGGEQQRIAIARAILKNAPILILDEATAFADPDNEVRVQQALSALSKGKTVIMIAHRLSSITDADCIYVLQDGEIVESGTHSGLIERNGIFTKMWKDYSEAAEWKIAKEVNA